LKMQLFILFDLKKYPYYHFDTISPMHSMEKK